MSWRVSICARGCRKPGDGAYTAGCAAAARCASMCARKLGTVWGARSRGGAVWLAQQRDHPRPLGSIARIEVRRGLRVFVLKCVVIALVGARGRLVLRPSASAADASRRASFECPASATPSPTRCSGLTVRSANHVVTVAFVRRRGKANADVRTHRA